MLAWLTRIVRSPRAGPTLAQRLRDYPPFEAPHAGPGESLALAQAQQNLAYLQEVREQRLRLVGTLLADDGLDPRAALAGADPLPLLDALHLWANQQLPALHAAAPQIATRAHWMHTRRTGGDIAYSLLMDIALLLGELIILGRPAFHWGLDLDPGNGRDGMTSYRRPVLLAPRQGSSGELALIDIEEIVVVRLLQPGNPSLSLLNGWRDLVVDARGGAHDRAF